jgi:hypothetical protein
MQNLVKKYSRPNVSTLQSSVFIRGDLKKLNAACYILEDVEIFISLGNDISPTASLLYVSSPFAQLQRFPTQVFNRIYNLPNLLQYCAPTICFDRSHFIACKTCPFDFEPLLSLPVDWFCRHMKLYRTQCSLLSGWPTDVMLLHNARCATSGMFQSSLDIVPSVPCFDESIIYRK